MRRFTKHQSSTLGAFVCGALFVSVLYGLAPSILEEAARLASGPFHLHHPASLPPRAAAGNHAAASPPASAAPQRMLVVPKLKKDDISWLDIWLPELPKTVYTPDDPSTPHHVPQNKGLEAEVYLTYILDHYDQLPEKVVFLHPHRSSWHMRDAVPALNSLRWDAHEYVNLRCEHLQGCSGGMDPVHPKDDQAKAYAAAWPAIFEAELGPLPANVSTQCCAQFLVSRRRIQAHPRAFYERCREWLLTQNKHTRHNAAKVFEFAWHLMFGQPAVHCPAEQQCRCDVYGDCGA